MLIDETNWKQELAKLKARRILLVEEKKALLGTPEKQWEQGINQVFWRELQIEELDISIEVIENVFVHKRYYI